LDAEVELTSLVKTFPGIRAVDGVSLRVERGEFLTLLGPSGCGKSTLLRLIAGFEIPDAGRIRIGEWDVTNRPAHERKVNTVFQHYSLFPHLTVSDNIAFGLRIRKLSSTEIDRKVQQALGLVRLPGYGGRSPQSLSGGEMQRVALARALVLEPAVLLLDEPLAALDSKLRKEMQVELKALQERLGFTFVFVTHDQEEALTLSDRVAVMRAGRIEQIGDAFSIYESPETRFVAEFMGVKNYFDCRVETIDRGEALVRSEGGLGIQLDAAAGLAAGDRVLIAVRSEKVRLGGRTESGGNHARGKVLDEVYRGSTTEWLVELNERERITVQEPMPNPAGGKRCQRGDTVDVAWPASACLRLRE
jgi:spermidine/putrescine transport system ATP-binding protein